MKSTTKTNNNKNNKTLIETIGLYKSFFTKAGEVLVLKNINIKVKQGEFVIIFGPSGCGKSTLLHSLLGLEPPTKGKVLIEGVDFYQMSKDKRALYRRHKVGMIYQQPLWIGSLDVYSNLSFPLYLLDMDENKIKEKVNKNLSLVGLSQWSHYKPTELSSGQQQKISLARALMIDPLVIVADEPTGNLDTVSGQELLNTFLELVKTNKTIIMVTHDLEYLKYATKIFHIVDGEVVEEYIPKGKKNMIRGKKEIDVTGKTSNVRDKNFLRDLNL